MSHIRFVCGPALVTAACLAAATVLDAQTLTVPTARAARGLFGRSTTGDQSLEVQVSSVGAYDDNLSEEVGNTSSDPRALDGGYYSRVTSNVAYMRKFNGGEFGIGEASAIRYYPSLSSMSALQHAVGGRARFSFGGTSLDVGQSYAFMPFFAFAALPQLFSPGVGDAPVVPADHLTVRHDQHVVNSSVDLSHPLGRRTTLTLTGTLHDTHFGDEATGLRTESFGGRVSRGLNRDLSLIAGYTYQGATYELASTLDRIASVHNMDVGVDYNRPLGQTHRTQIGFTTGTTAVEQPNADVQYRFIGSARLNREIGRTWHATATYNRNVGFVDGFQEPFFADTMATSIGGTLNRRVAMLMTGGYSIGKIGLTPSLDSRNDMSNYNASAQVRVAVSRFAQVTTDWFLYRYQIGSAATLMAGVPPHLERTGFRIGLDLWLPLIQ